MSKRYTTDHKQLILTQLDANGGNIALTSLQTRVPERTLRQWRQERLLHAPPPTPEQRRQIPEFKDDAERLKFVRQQLLDELVQLANSFSDTLRSASPHHRVLALTQLIDRLEHLDKYIPLTERTVTYRIQYVDPQGKTWKDPGMTKPDDEPLE